MKDNIRSAIKELVIDLNGDDVTEKIIEIWLVKHSLIKEQTILDEVWDNEYDERWNDEK